MKRLLFIVLLLIIGCNEDPTPKPQGIGLLYCGDTQFHNHYTLYSRVNTIQLVKPIEAVPSWIEADLIEGGHISIPASNCHLEMDKTETPRDFLHN